jgi:hypothetical protein
MINLTEAKNIVRTYLQKREREAGESLEIVEAETIERPFGWVFFYNSRNYLKTKKFEDMLLGNAPLIVDRETGQLHVTGTAESIEHYISEYEAKRAS